jgi:hypothetical protein
MNLTTPYQFPRLRRLGRSPIYIYTNTNVYSSLIMMDIFKLRIHLSNGTTVPRLYCLYFFTS